jgi:NAD(P)-dependent dehydrogenase (short-subunit alcohol dehydrogenase family)
VPEARGPSTVHARGTLCAEGAELTVTGPAASAAPLDGNEMTFQVNYLAGFLLTGLLRPRLAATPGSRVLVTSSMINVAGRIDLGDLNRARRPYRQFAAYADSKLASILFVRELARQAPTAGRPRPLSIPVSCSASSAAIPGTSAG